MRDFARYTEEKRTLANEGISLFFHAHEPVGVHALTLEDIMRDTPTKSCLCGLIAQSYPEVLHALADRCCSKDGLVHERDIYRLIRMLGASGTAEKTLRRAYPLNAETTGSADFQCLGTSLSTLCSSAKDEIVWTSFHLWDTDHRGCITKASMADYLRSVFIVVYDRNPRFTQLVGATASQLAKTTVDEVFKDLGITDTITYEQFQQWSGSNENLRQP